MESNEREKRMRDGDRESTERGEIEQRETEGDSMRERAHRGNIE